MFHLDEPCGANIFYLQNLLQGFRPTLNFPIYRGRITVQRFEVRDSGLRAVAGAGFWNRGPWGGRTPSKRSPIRIVALATAEARPDFRDRACSNFFRSNPHWFSWRLGGELRYQCGPCAHLCCRSLHVALHARIMIESLQLIIYERRARAFDSVVVSPRARADAADDPMPVQRGSLMPVIMSKPSFNQALGYFVAVPCTRLHSGHGTVVLIPSFPMFNLIVAILYAVIDPGCVMTDVP